MKPQDIYRNGDGGAGGVLSHDDDSESEEACPVEEELSLYDAAAPARALAALNALRKSRQHYDVLLLAGGAEVPAHRAVLAAASPYLLDALGTPPAAPSPAPAPSPALPAPAPAYRVDDVDADALRDLVEYAYTGRLRVPSAARARSLYRAAWRLRLDLPRQHLAAALLKRLTPADCLDVRALPDLAPHHLADLDAYIAQNFDEVCESGALGALPLIRIEMLRESSAEGGGEAPLAVADAALTWLRERRGGEADLRELCARTHLLYVDASGALRDCGELPAARGDAPELQEYRREAAERGRVQRRAHHHHPPVPLPGLELGARSARDACAVLAARAGGAGGAAGAGGAGRATRALLAVRGALAAARVAWRDVGAGAGGAGVARGGTLGGAGAGAGAHTERAHMLTGRCALGAAELNGRLVVCGGYDRARVLRSAEWYSASENSWSPLPDMRRARARFPAARLAGRLYLVGGSDGHSELDSVEVLHQDRWEARARLPLALSHAAAAAHEAAAELYVVGGWAAGLSLKRVLKYSPQEDKWTDAPPLNIGRSQCAGVWYSGALWALGGCDAWHCLDSTERLGWRGRRCPRRGGRWARRRGAASWWWRAGRTAAPRCAAPTGSAGRRRRGAAGPRCGARAPAWRWRCCTTRSTRWAGSTARSSCRASSASTSPRASGPRSARPHPCPRARHTHRHRRHHHHCRRNQTRRTRRNPKRSRSPSQFSDLTHTHTSALTQAHTYCTYNMLFITPPV